MEEGLFDINKFNIIQDEENYYFFRALNRADNRDVEEGITLDEEGKIVRIRTDRERYLENPENGTPKYNAEDEISLEQAHDHIKIHYRKDTNCISLASDANVVIDYGRGNYKDRYVMVKVPKKEIGEKVKFAGQYMLEEIEKRVENYISSLNPDDERDSEILEELDRIDKSQSTEEIKEIVKTTNRIPSYWEIGRVYQRLILMVNSNPQEYSKTIIEVLSSWIIEKIDNYNSSMYYENPEYIFSCYKEGKIL